MDTKLVVGNIADVETECLVVIAIDHGEKQKNEPKLAIKDGAADKAAAELISAGEVTGKQAEAVMLHRPQGLKAKRLLVAGGGKAKEFSHTAVRKAAGAAVRFLKPKMIKTCAFVLPELSSGVEDSMRAVVEGAFIANFDPDTYRSDRKDLQMKEITIIAPNGSDQGKLQQELEQARIIG